MATSPFLWQQVRSNLYCQLKIYVRLVYHATWPLGDILTVHIELINLWLRHGQGEEGGVRRPEESPFIEGTREREGNVSERSQNIIPLSLRNSSYDTSVNLGLKIELQ